MLFVFYTYVCASGKQCHLKWETLSYFWPEILWMDNPSSPLNRKYRVWPFNDKLPYSTVTRSFVGVCVAVANCLFLHAWLPRSSFSVRAWPPCFIYLFIYLFSLFITSKECLMWMSQLSDLRNNRISRNIDSMQTRLIFSSSVLKFSNRT